MKCPNCGAPMSASERCCRYCGTDYDDVPTARATEAQPVVHVHYHQEAPRPQPEVRVERVYVPREIRSDRSRLVAFLLCLVFGWLGVHRFYLGKLGTGVLYLFTYGLFGFGWFVDLIVLLLGNPRDKYHLPLKWR